MRTLTKKRRETAEVALEAARLTQTAYWKSLSILEACLGIEVDGTADLRDTNLENLLATNK